MRALVIGVALATSVFAGTLKSDFQKLDPNQKYVLNETFVKGKEFNLGLTMAAIAWHESQAGAIPVNLADPSCGVFHNLITSVANRHGIRNTSFNRNVLCTRLVRDFDFSFSEALSELKYWENYYKKQPKAWEMTVRSYNAGFTPENGGNYYKAIRSKVRFLKYNVFLDNQKEK